jgi:hypothetical protein
MDQDGNDAEAAPATQVVPIQLFRLLQRDLNRLIGEPGGTRTHGPKIKSLVLYHLSYGLRRPP